MHIIVVDMGVPDHLIHVKYGSYSKWFQRAYENINESIMVDGFGVAEVDLEDLLECDGVILSGAEENVGDDLPWRERFDPMARALVDHRQPLLGVCFGHQYLADLLGGSVLPMETGLEQFGNYVVELTANGESDPLFRGVPRSGFFIQSHFQMVASPPSGAVVLGGDEDAAVQAFRCGEAVWGVQFHPEMTPGIVMSIIDSLDYSEEKKEARKFEAQNAHDGLRVLANFAEICRERKGRTVQ